MRKGNEMKTHKHRQISARTREAGRAASFSKQRIQHIRSSVLCHKFCLLLLFALVNDIRFYISRLFGCFSRARHPKVKSNKK
jgi:hypothetical protein